MPREQGAPRGCHRRCCHLPVTAFRKAGLVSPQPLLGFEPLASPCRFPDARELPRAIGMKRSPSSRPVLGGKVRNAIRFSGGLIGFSGYFQKVVSVCFRFLFVWGEKQNILLLAAFPKHEQVPQDTVCTRAELGAPASAPCQEVGDPPSCARSPKPRCPPLW